MPAAIPIAASVAGSMVSSAMNKSSNGGGSSASASSEPWAEAAPWLKNNVRKGQELQEQYEAQPFNPLQQTAYQNAFSDIDNYRNSFMPSMMQFAGGLLGPNFQMPAAYTAAGMSQHQQQRVQQGAQLGAQWGAAGLLGNVPSRAGPAWSTEQLQGAGNFMRDNIDNPDLIRQEASRLGLSNRDLLSAARTVDPNISMSQVSQYMGREDPQYGQPYGGQPRWSPEQVQGAGSFIRDNIENPALIRQEAARYGLSNADILSAAQTVNPGISLGQVDQYMGRRDPQYARPSFGLIDWNTVGPRVTANATALAQALANETPEQRRRREEEEYLRNSGMYYGGAGDASSGTGDGGIGGAGGVGPGGNGGAAGAAAAGAAAGAGPGAST